MTELEMLQQKHRDEAARKRAKFKERKIRAHRLIERGAILESVINEIRQSEELSNEQIQQILNYSLLDPSTIDFIADLK